MKIDIKVPAVGESITEATIGEWLKKDGEAVKKNDVLMSLETDKATVEVVAEQDGVLKTLSPAGTVVQIGAVVGSIDSVGTATAVSSTPDAPPPMPQAAAPSPAPAVSTGGGMAVAAENLSPAVRRVVAERGIDPSTVTGTGKDGRLTKADVEGTQAKAPTPTPSVPTMKAPGTGATSQEGGVRRVKMTTIRKRIAERLVQAQHTAALLTTFNEVDMSQVMALREKYKDDFKKRYGVSLGFMGFFVKASIEALRTVPAVGAFIEGDELVFHDYCNIGVAVGTEKGLVVPVIKNAEKMTISEIELGIREFALKARDGKIAPNDMSGGTFTISNGGVYGSLMSTPILNAPQSGILGMHKIEDRPVVVNGQIVIRPMMYLALSYDHRVIDGKEAVTFLVKIKECIEDPSRILLEI